MIIKLIQGQDFAGLEHYLTHGREHDIMASAGVSCAQDAAIEMTLVAAERSDVRVPALHVIFAAAPADWPKLTDELWWDVFNDFEAEFHLSGHQKLIVRHPHPDPHTNGPHIHCAYNKVHPLTFDLPPIYKADRSRWDSGAEQRAWAVADAFAERHGLERVADPTTVNASGRIPNWVTKREEAEGIVSVARFAPEIRAALEQPSWPQRIEGLAELGLKIVPTYDPTDTSEFREIVGIRVADSQNPGNFMKGSDFGREFSFTELEKSRAPDTPSLDKMSNEGALGSETHSSFPILLDTHAIYLGDFRRDVAEWRRLRKEMRARRETLKERHRDERSALSEELGADRKALVKNTPTAFVSGARAAFARMVVTPKRDAMHQKHREELGSLELSRKPVWKDWLQQRAAGGDRRAEALLVEMTNRQGVFRTPTPAVAVEPKRPPANISTSRMNAPKGPGLEAADRSTSDASPVKHEQVQREAERDIEVAGHIDQPPVSDVEDVEHYARLVAWNARGAGPKR